jgi:hypothetical protein
MGQKIKRVPLDFDWPLNVIWPGYRSNICGIIDDLTDGTGMGHCETCRSFCRLIGRKINIHNGCPENMDTFEVPKGPGWQLWGHSFADSPVSPVFETPEEFARWLAEEQEGTYEQWLQRIHQWEKKNRKSLG